MLNSVDFLFHDLIRTTCTVHFNYELSFISIKIRYYSEWKYYQVSKRNRIEDRYFYFEYAVKLL